jgi:hypothetical protein
MLKTNADKIAKPALPLLVYSVLKGYLKSPLKFMIGTLLGFGRFKKELNSDFPKDFIDSAAFMAWLYIRLNKYISKKEAFELTRACILTSGLSVQQANFRNVECERSLENLVKYQQRANREGSTRLNTIEIVEDSDTKYSFKVTRCLFFEFFTELKIPELTTIMCSIDNAIFSSYMPEELVFHRNGLNNTIAAGAKECTFVIDKISRVLKK